MSIEKVQSACRSLERAGAWLAWGLPTLGVLRSGERIVALIDSRAYSPSPAGLVRVLISIAYLIFGYGLAGLATLVVSRFIATAVTAHFDSIIRDGQQRSDQLESIHVAIERLWKIRDLQEGRSSNPDFVSDSVDDRARSLSEVQSAIRGSLFAEAMTMLDDFAARYPDDPSLAELQQELSASRLKVNREQMAQLDAAREVNDPDRVLEIYDALARSLEFEGRRALDRDLAKWFLTLIHRRLRTGTIQADVVQLASRFAEAFATTVEGASVRAALPTLRRSVGLCPRCSGPYVGLDEACPKCLKGGVN